MKWCRFNAGRWGFVRDGHVFDVTDTVTSIVARPDLATTLIGDAFIAHLSEIGSAVHAAGVQGPACSEEEARFLSPVRTPTKIIGTPVNYEKHIAEAEADHHINFGRIVERIEAAGLFLKASSSLVGPSDGVHLRFPQRRTDHEVEVAVVIGRTCASVSPESAASSIAGYAIALDVTLRGTEDRSFRKSLDSYSVLGPYLLTPDEFADPGNLDFALRVNGEVRQSSNTRWLIKDIPSIVSWASEWYTLYPGDVIMTGTPEGTGPLDAGDVIECTLGDTVHMRVDVTLD